MLYTGKTVRDNIRNREGKRVFYLKAGDTLTSEARDFLNGERIEILPADQARKEEQALLTGGFVREKPEHMTHLNGDVLVHKSHRRIRFRGAIDSLEAEILLCQQHFPELEASLQEILTLARMVIRCDVLETPLVKTQLCGLDEQQLRRQSHFPQEYFGIPHFMPESGDTPKILRLNRLRCMARNTELLGVDAFCDRDGNPTRTDILQALNRMSSMLYILMLREKAQLRKE